MSEKHPDIELSIGELVLHGVPDLQRAALEHELRQELTRLLALEPPRRSTVGRIDRRHPVEIRLGGGDQAGGDRGRGRGGPSGNVGRQLAQVIHGAVKR